jgi:hypothetical protein
MLRISSMPRTRPVFCVLLLSAIFTPRSVRAQSISSPSVEPDRLVNGQAATLRPAGLNPYGISYADCMNDMTLRFTISVSGFTAGQSVQVWGSKTSATGCVDLAERGSGTSPVCWTVSPSIVGPTTAGVVQLEVRVQDLVGWQSVPPTTQQEALNPPPKGPEACTAQPTFAVVPMTVNFIGVDGDGNPVGTPYIFSIQTDLVGPPAPRGLCEAAGETLLNLSWTPNSDSDTIGYDFYVAPIPALVPTDANIGVDSGPLTVCPATSGDWEGGCFTVQSGSTLSPESGTCADNAICANNVLTGAVVPDAGTGASDAGDDGGGVESDSGASIGDDGGTEVGSGGISSVPAEYLYQATPTQLTILGGSVAQYNMTGLVDYVTYNVALAAVDGMGNIGPPSPEVCDYPEPVNDFWQTYEQDGGGKSGYCALETIGVGGSSLAGIACAATVGALVRRRRRKVY